MLLLPTQLMLCLHASADSNSEITMKPQPTEEEIQFILDSISEFLRVKVTPIVT